MESAGAARAVSEGLQTAGVSASDSWWVIRRISSMVVRPFMALIIPSSKSVCIPCLRATLRMAWVGSPLKVMSRIVLVMTIISWMPIRPR